MNRFGCYLLVLFLNVVIGGFATQYVVNFWVSLIQGVPVHIPFIYAALAGLFVGQFLIPAAIVTWILSFVISVPQ